MVQDFRVVRVFRGSRSVFVTLFNSVSRAFPCLSAPFHAFPRFKKKFSAAPLLAIRSFPALSVVVDFFWDPPVSSSPQNVTPCNAAQRLRFPNSRFAPIKPYQGKSSQIKPYKGKNSRGLGLPLFHFSPESCPHQSGPIGAIRSYPQNAMFC